MGPPRPSAASSERVERVYGDQIGLSYAFSFYLSLEITTLDVCADGTRVYSERLPGNLSSGVAGVSGNIRRIPLGGVRGISATAFYVRVLHGGILPK